MHGATVGPFGPPPDNPAPPRVPAPEHPLWQPTTALVRAGAVIAACLLLGIVFGRPDLIVIAAPFVIGTGIALARRPRRPVTARLRIEEDGLAEGAPLAATVTVTNDDDTPISTTVHALVPRWIGLRHGAGRYIDHIGPGESTGIRLHGTVRRWGTHVVGPVKVSALACDGLLRSPARVLDPVSVRVYPIADPFDSRQPLPGANGMSGIHRSRRPGDGGELAEVRQFRAGDRLRRIDWRVSLRQRQLHVNATLSERDADVLVIMDVLHEAGESGGIGGDTTVIDATVRAAAAITEHYTHQGDRVRIVEFGPRMRRLRAGSGRRHYRAALDWLLDTRVVPGNATSGERLIQAATRERAALIVMLTPLLDERSTQALATLARTGHKLITVDTLGSRVLPPPRGVWTPLATRLWRLERANTIGRLRELGVGVEPWAGPGSLDLMLADIARVARAPKVVR